MSLSKIYVNDLDAGFEKIAVTENLSNGGINLKAGDTILANLATQAEMMSAQIIKLNTKIAKTELGLLMYDGSINSTTYPDYRIYTYNIPSNALGKELHITANGLPNSTESANGFALCRFIHIDESITAIPLTSSIGYLSISDYKVDVPSDAKKIQIASNTGGIDICYYFTEYSQRGYSHLNPEFDFDVKDTNTDTIKNSRLLNKLLTWDDITNSIIWDNNKIAYIDKEELTIISFTGYNVGICDVSSLVGEDLRILCVTGSESAVCVNAFADDDLNLIGNAFKIIETKPDPVLINVPDGATKLVLTYYTNSAYPVELGHISAMNMSRYDSAIKSFNDISISWTNNKFAIGGTQTGLTITFQTWLGNVYRLGEIDVSEFIGKTIQINCISDKNYNYSVDSYLVDADNKIIIRNLYMNEGTPIREIIIPLGASKLFLSNKYSQYPDAWVREIVDASCYEMKEDIEELQDVGEQVSTNADNITDLYERLGLITGDGAQWSGKKWYAYGTSITETDNEYHTGKYAPYLASMSQMLLTNIGIGGGGITNYGAYSRGQVKSAIMNTTDGKLNADLITFEVGANDTTNDDSKLGTIFDTTDETFCGCLNQCIRYLLENTNAQIVVMPSVVSKTEPSETQNYYKMADLIKQVCYLNKVYFLDGCCGLGWARIKNGNTYTVDNIHQSELGGYILAKYMWSKIKNIPTWDLNVPNN